MMISKNIFYLLLLIWCCRNPTGYSNDTSDNDLLPDSLFVEFDPKFYTSHNLDAVLATGKLVRVNGGLKNEISKKLNDVDGSFEIYYYSKHRKVYGFTPIVILLDGIERTTYIMTLVSDNGKVSSVIDLTLDECFLLDQTDEKEDILCNIRETDIVNDSILHVVTKIVSKEDFGDFEKSITDSLTEVYRIMPTANFELQRRDSVRLSPQSGAHLPDKK